MIKLALTVIAVLVVAFLVAAALQPADFRVARSIAIAAPPAVAFAQVNNLHLWQGISPYAKLDEAARYTFDGPESGLGAALSWSGNNKIGEGRMTITESRTNELVRMKLDFVKPFASTCLAEFTFRPEQEQTTVTWSMSGPKNFVSKAVGLIMNMDKMIGGQFEEGLANLKRVAEAQAKASTIR